MGLEAANSAGKRQYRRWIWIVLASVDIVIFFSIGNWFASYREERRSKDLADLPIGSLAFSRLTPEVRQLNAGNVTANLRLELQNQADRAIYYKVQRLSFRINGGQTIDVVSSLPSREGRIAPHRIAEFSMQWEGSTEGYASTLLGQVQYLIDYGPHRRGAMRTSGKTVTFGNIERGGDSQHVEGRADPVIGLSDQIEK